MIRVICPKCKAKHEYPDTHAGRIASCLECNTSIILPEAGDEEWGEPAPALIEDDPPAAKTFVKSAALIAALVAVALTLFFGAIAVIQASKAPPPKTQEQLREEAKQAAADKAKSAKLQEDAGKLGSILMGLLILAAIAGWVVAIYFTGAWIARDAFRRGMNGLAWAWFYFAFQIINRIAVLFPLLFLRGIFLTAAAYQEQRYGERTGGVQDVLTLAPLTVILLTTEMIHWGGFYVYLYCRRTGQLRPCKRCNQMRMVTLQACPHCKA